MLGIQIMIQHKLLQILYSENTEWGGSMAGPYISSTLDYLHSFGRIRNLGLRRITSAGVLKK